MLRTARLRSHRFDVRIAPDAGWSLQGGLALSLTGLPPASWSKLCWAHQRFHRCQIAADAS